MSQSQNPNQKAEREFVTIDVFQVLKALAHKIWLIVLVGVVGAVVAFCYSSFYITPMYSSSILLYVNNNSIDIGGSILGNLTYSDLTASRYLVNTYSVILKNRTTLEMIAGETGVEYSTAELYGMLSAGAYEETEVMQVTVTAPDPYAAAEIANSVAQVLPKRINEIINGTSMVVVDSAIPNTQKVSPSITKNTIIGAMIGAVVAAAIVAVLAVLDNTIKDEDYIIQTYGYPVLAKIPNLLVRNDGREHYYYYYSSPDSTDTK